MKSLLLAAGLSLIAGGALAQAGYGGGSPPQGPQAGQGSQTDATGGDGQAPGVPPREAWRRYMMEHGGQDGQAGGMQGGHHGMRPGMMAGPGMMMRGGPPAPRGASFFFDRQRGRIYIQCAPADSTEACAKAVMPMIDTILGSDGGEGSYSDDQAPDQAAAPDKAPDGKY